jgi:hypothetical protein
VPYCPNCGTEYEEGARFCRNCAQALGEHAPPMPPPQQSPLQRFSEGWQGTGEEGTRFSDPAPPTPSDYQQRGPGVWSGVKIGCGMFIVLPILIIIGILLIVLFLQAI